MTVLARLFAALLLLPIPGASIAASTEAVPAEAAILSPLSMIKRADLDFGTVVVTGAGTVVVNPVNGATTATGGVLPAGSASHPALFTATGSRNAVAIVRLPKNPITLTRVGGTQTLTVSDWTLDGNQTRHIPITDTFDFAVGARATIAAGQAQGRYVGTFTVTVQYP